MAYFRRAKQEDIMFKGDTGSGIALIFIKGGEKSGNKCRFNKYKCKFQLKQLFNEKYNKFNKLTPK